ncbi:hypothetical protein D3C78_1000350 [compost metagenome]
MRFKRGDVAYAAIDYQTDNACGFRRHREHFTPVASNEVGAITYQDATARRFCHGQVQAQVVTRRTLQRVSGGGDEGALPDSANLAVDCRRQPRGLIQGGAAEDLCNVLIIVWKAHGCLLCREW